MNNKRHIDRKSMISYVLMSKQNPIIILHNYQTLSKTPKQDRSLVTIPL